MRNLRRFLTHAAVAGSATVLAAACAEKKPSENPPTPPAQTAPSPSAAPGAATQASAAASSAMAPPRLFEKCKDAATDPGDDLPDAGVVMNNAAPVGDAGTSDRLQPVERTISQNRGRFRCCFDEGGPHPPNQIVKVTMVLELKQTGEVRAVSFDRAETDPTSEAVESCLADVARMFTYAESGVGKDTKFRHRFKFKTHR